MKKVEEMLTRTYQYNNDFFIDVVRTNVAQTKTGLHWFYEAWLYHKSYGIKMLMFGLEKDSLWGFLEQVQDNAVDYITDYQSMYMEGEHPAE